MRFPWLAAACASTALILAPAHSKGGAAVDIEPFSVFIGSPTGVLSGSIFQACAFIPLLFPSEVEVWAYLPDEPVESISFEVQFGDSLVSLGGQVWDSNIVELDEPGDDSWHLGFTGCEVRGGFRPVLRYQLLTVARGAQWICISSPSQSIPQWFDCSGNATAGVVFPEGILGVLDGCFPINSDELCPSETASTSWGVLKSRF